MACIQWNRFCCDIFFSCPNLCLWPPWGLKLRGFISFYVFFFHPETLAVASEEKTCSSFPWISRSIEVISQLRWTNWGKFWAEKSRIQSIVIQLTLFSKKSTKKYHSRECKYYFCGAFIIAAITGNAIEHRNENKMVELTTSAHSNKVTATIGHN